MYHQIVTIIVLQFAFSQTRVLPGNISNEFNSSTSSHVVEEIQHAICKISSADLDATANATITRQLKGVCTSAYLDERIHILEKTLTFQINNIKYFLEQTLNSFNKHDEQQKRTVKPFNKMQLIKSLKSTADRNLEITKFNMTTQKESNQLKFNYYWQIDNFVLSSTNAINSGDFYFAGNHIYMQIFPNYSHSGHTFIRIVDVEEFQLTYRFIVLDQEDEESDIISQLFFCGMQLNCNGYKIPHTILQTKNYIKNNTLLMKLFIYLHY